MKDIMLMSKQLKEKRGDKGFTLMEMLIVVAIIAILVAIAIPVFTSQLNNAKEAADEANARSMYAQLATAYMTDTTATASANKITAGTTITVTVDSTATAYKFSDVATAGDITVGVPAAGTTAGTAPSVTITTNGADYSFGK